MLPTWASEAEAAIGCNSCACAELNFCDDNEKVGVTRDLATVEAIFDRISKVAVATRSLRCLGSCALNLCRCGPAAEAITDLSHQQICCRMGRGTWLCASAAGRREQLMGELLDPRPVFKVHQESKVPGLPCCSVAMGRLDAFYEIGFGGPWDVAAAALILEEAGGRVADPAGVEFSLHSRRVLGTNGRLLEGLARIIAGAKCSAAEPQPPQ